MEEFPGKVKAENVDATTPEAAKAIKELGFKNHGLVIRAPNGRVLWKQPDHQVKIEGVRAPFRRLLRILVRHRPALVGACAVAAERDLLGFVSVSADTAPASLEQGS